MHMNEPMDNLLRETTIGTGAAEAREAAVTGELSLERLYDDYSRSLYRFALALTGSGDDAEDAVQEVFVRVARDTRRLRKVTSIKAYLYTSTRNAAYSILRSRRRRENAEAELCRELSLATEVAGGTPVDKEALCRAFAQLPVEQREVLVLKVYEEMTFREIAETTRTSANTVASRYRYAVDKLRQALEVNEHG